MEEKESLLPAWNALFTSADAPLANGSQLPAASGRQVVDSGDWSGLCSARWKTADADADLL